VAVTGLDLDYVISLPLPAFDSLAGSVTRFLYREKIDKFYAAVTAAQGTQEAIKNLMQQWEILAGIAPRYDDKRFRAEFGKGF
jgi:hypothetical protein